MYSASDILSNLVDLQTKYAQIHRALPTHERYTNLIISEKITEYSYGDEIIREPLIEHVGHLPILATYLYDKIEHAQNIDIGRVLIMLAVHDIGELKTGDTITYHKKESDEANEYDHAQNVLSNDLFTYYQEIENQSSVDGQYAKAIDAIAPLLHELALPEVTKERFEYFDFSPDDIEDRKRKHFQWDAVLNELFDEIMNRIRQF